MAEHVWHASYDPEVPRILELEEITLAGMLRRSADRFPDRTALIFMNRRMTYRELAQQVDRLATAMSQLGVKKDSRVAIHLPNIPQCVIAYYATQTLGAQVVMTNPLYVPREIEHQWNDAAVELAICGDWLYQSRIQPIAHKLPVRHYIVASIPEYLKFPLNLLAPLKLKKAKPVPLIAKVPTSDSVHHFKRLVDSTPPELPEVTVGMDDLAALQYTGGTTGLSKGAMLTQRNLSANAQQASAWFPILTEKDLFLASLPYFHVFGNTICMLLPVCVGAAMVLLPNPRDIPQTIKSIQKHRVTMVPAVPAIFNAINNRPDIEKADLSCVVSCFSGSAPLPVESLRRFEELTGATICEGFGMTETSPVTHVNPMGKRKVGSIGVPVTGTEAKVVDPEDGWTEMPVGEAGELIVKGPQVMSGYWNRSRETANALRDGWMFTGDLATRDDEGYFTIVGRKKDMIITGGYNIYPDEVDEVLTSHPDILEAATIGVPDDCKGEVIKSFVVFQPDRSLSPEELRAYCKEHLAAYKVPKLWGFLEELPKSSMMKILRRELRAREIEKMA